MEAITEACAERRSACALGEVHLRRREFILWSYDCHRVVVSWIPGFGPMREVMAVLGGGVAAVEPSH